jgi:type III restriction enzyme
VDPLFTRIVINDAYTEPAQHLNLLRRSDSEPEVLPGRRLAGYFIGGRSSADAMVTEREWRPLDGVNKIRERVGRWRQAGYPGVTPVTRKLLDCWNRSDRPGVNLFFCQREAAETIIWLTEAPESDRAGLREIAAPDPFVRYCCKMATGAGKTTVMAMLAAWSVINKVTNRQDARFSDAVLVVCPNLTVKERLQVLYPSHPKNDYDEKGLLPPETDFKERLAQGKFQVSNWHQLATIRDEGKRQVLQRGEESDPAFCRRVLTELGAKSNLLVFNDEAHHAYRKNPEVAIAESADEEILETEDLEEFEREATVWVEGLDRIHRDRSVRLCVDLTATPYYIARSGYEDGTPFPWIVTDFGLVDAVESGIVKVPRVPRGDDSGQSEPRYLHLWEHIRHKMPKRALDGDPGDVPLTKILMESEGALRSLAHLWRRTFQSWQGQSEVPPCMIVVCNNTRTAEVMANFLSSGEVLEDLRNTETEERTFRIDSALLRRAESEAGGDAKAEELRRKVATVGKPGPPEQSPGGQIRCVVSVAMLSEGWDARNVTQILGLRAFTSQLLCEQVIGRGLRRSSSENLIDPEFVDIYGVPFQLLPVQRQAPGGAHKPATHVRALPERAELEITFPRVVGFFLDVRSDLEVDESKLEPLEMKRETEPGRVEVDEGATYYGGGGKGKLEDDLPDRAGHHRDASRGAPALPLQAGPRGGEALRRDAGPDERHAARDARAPQVPRRDREPRPTRDPDEDGRGDRASDPRSGSADGEDPPRLVHDEEAHLRGDEEPRELRRLRRRGRRHASRAAVGVPSGSGPRRASGRALLREERSPRLRDPVRVREDAGALPAGLPRVGEAARRRWRPHAHHRSEGRRRQPGSREVRGRAELGGRGESGWQSRGMGVRSREGGRGRVVASGSDGLLETLRWTPCSRASVVTNEDMEYERGEAPALGATPTFGRKRLVPGLDAAR